MTHEKTHSKRQTLATMVSEFGSAASHYSMDEGLQTPVALLRTWVCGSCQSQHSDPYEPLARQGAAWPSCPFARVFVEERQLAEAWPNRGVDEPPCVTHCHFGAPQAVVEYCQVYALAVQRSLMMTMLQQLGPTMRIQED